VHSDREGRVKEQRTDEVRRPQTGGRTQGKLVLGGRNGDKTVTPMLMDRLVGGEICIQGAYTGDNDASETTLRLMETTGFPVEQMVSHVFSLDETEDCIRAVGGEVPEMFPTKALIRPS